MSNVNRLALGTVQIGQPYGISNINGQVSKDMAATILNRARSKGLDTLDTAIVYGESEQRLGIIGINDWKVVSKLPEFPGIGNATAWIEEQVQNSLDRLKISRLKGLLLHQPKQLLGPEGKSLWTGLQVLKKAGIIEKVGFSIYDPCELDILWPSYPPDLVQAPFNILDRRLLTSGWLKHMNDAGVEVHVRSVFLQGLLLMSDSDRPKKFDQWSNIWKIWNTWLYSKGITALQACLSFVMSESYINRVIVGVDNLQQLDEILCSTEIKIQEFPQELETDDIDLINPSRWNLL